MEWAINSFAPYKSLGMDRIIPALLQEGQSIVIPYLVRVFCSCLATGYVQAIWHQIKRVFIPIKPAVVPILDLGILDASVSHHSYLRPWRGWWIVI